MTTVSKSTTAATTTSTTRAAEPAPTPVATPTTTTPTSRQPDLDGKAAATKLLGTTPGATTPTAVARSGRSPPARSSNGSHCAASRPSTATSTARL